MKAPIACLLFFTLFAAAFGQPSLSIAREYVGAAAEASEAGDRALAADLLSVALEYDDRSSDALSLLGQELVSEQTTSVEGISMLERAVAIDRFYDTSRNESIVSLATALYETHSPDRAIDLLESIVVDPRDSRQLARKHAHTLVSALIQMNRRSDAARELRLARDLFPNDPRLLSLELELEPLPTIEHARELDRLARVASIDTNTRTTGADTAALHEALLRYAMRAPTAGEQQQALNQYIANGGDDPRALILLARFDLDRTEALFREWDAWRSLELLRDPVFNELSEREPISAELGAANGEVFARDVNGRWRERLTVRSGVVESWQLDENRDGVSEIDVRFADGVPTSLRLVTDDGTVEFEYGLYPFVESAHVALHSGQEVFVLRPRSIVVRPLNRVLPQGVDLSTLPMLVPMEPPSIATLRQAAIRVDLFDATGIVIERRYHARGDLMHRARDRNGDGRWDSIEVSRGGVAQRRAHDIDFDGYFEILEGFRGGRRLVRAVDEDEDGVPELFEREIGVSVREWDINEDGRIDVREFEGWRASIVRDFPIIDQEL